MLQLNSQPPQESLDENPDIVQQPDDLADDFIDDYYWMSVLLDRRDDWTEEQAEASGFGNPGARPQGG